MKYIIAPRLVNQPACEGASLSSGRLRVTLCEREKWAMAKEERRGASDGSMTPLRRRASALSADDIGPPSRDRRQPQGAQVGWQSKAMNVIRFTLLTEGGVVLHCMCLTFETGLRKIRHVTCTWWIKAYHRTTTVFR